MLCSGLIVRLGGFHDGGMLLVLTCSVTWSTQWAGSLEIGFDKVLAHLILWAFTPFLSRWELTRQQSV